MSRYLSAYDLTPGADPADWRKIEKWLVNVIEPSQEPRPGGDRIRPMAKCFLFDLSLSYLISAQALLPEQAAGFDQGERFVPKRLHHAFPTLRMPNDARLFDPADTMMSMADLLIQGGRGDVLRSSLNALVHPLVTETVAQIHADLYEWEKRFERDAGRAPSLDDLAEYAASNSIAAESVPTGLIAKLERGS